MASFLLRFRGEGRLRPVPISEEEKKKKKKRVQYPRVRLLVLLPARYLSIIGASGNKERRRRRATRQGRHRLGPLFFVFSGLLDKVRFVLFLSLLASSYICKGKSLRKTARRIASRRCSPFQNGGGAPKSGWLRPCLRSPFFLVPVPCLS